MNQKIDRPFPMVQREEALLRSIIGVCEEIIALAKTPPAADVARVLDIAEARFFLIGEDFYLTSEEHAESFDKAVGNRPIRSISDLRARLRRINRKWDEPGLIVIDSLQQLAGPVCTEESRISMDALLRTIDALAREMSVPILVLSELSS